MVIPCSRCLKDSLRFGAISSRQREPRRQGFTRNPGFQEWNGRKNSHVSTKGNKTNLNAIKEFSGKTLQQEGISKTHLHNISPTTNSEYKASCYLFGAEIIHQRVATLGVVFQVFSSPFLIFFLAGKKKKT